MAKINKLSAVFSCFLSFVLIFTTFAFPTISFASINENDIANNTFFDALKIGANKMSVYELEKQSENSYNVAVPVDVDCKTGIFLMIDDEYVGEEEIQILKNDSEYAAIKNNENQEIKDPKLSVSELKAGIYLADFKLSKNGNGASFNIKVDDRMYQINVTRFFKSTLKAGADADTPTVLEGDENGIYSFNLTVAADNIQLIMQVGTSMTAKYADVLINNQQITRKGAQFSTKINLTELDVKNGVACIPIEIKANSSQAANTKNLSSAEYCIKVVFDFDYLSFSHDADGTENYQLSPQFSRECKDYTLTVPNTYDKIYVRGISSENREMKAKYSDTEVSVFNDYKYVELPQCISEGDNEAKITFISGDDSYNINIVRNPTLNNLKVKAGDKTLRLNRDFSKGVNQYYVFIPETSSSVNVIGDYDVNAYKFFVEDVESVDGSSEYSIEWGKENQKVLTITIKSIESADKIGSYQLILVRGDSDTPFIAKETNFEKTEYTKTDIKQKKTKQLGITAVVPKNGSLSYQWERLYDGWEVQEYRKINDAKNDTFNIEGDWAAGTWKIRCKVTNTVGKEQYNVYSNECEIYVDAERAETPTFRYLSNNPRDYKLMLGGAAEVLDATVSYSDGGSAEYQWYVNDSKSTENGTAIEEAESPIFLPPTDSAGTKYYYCVVNHKVQDYIASITSAPIKIEVVEAKVLLNDKGIVGEGTIESPFEIYSEQNLTTVRELVGDGCTFNGSYFLLKESIKLSSDWKPIGQIAGQEPGFDLSDKKDEQYTYTGKGTKLLPFSGTFDGNQKKITTANNGLPLFGICRNATIKNLNIAGLQIAGNGLIQNYVVDYGTDGDYNTGCPTTVTIENVTIKSGTSTLRSGFLSGYASGANTVNIVNCKIEEDVVIGYNHDQSKIGSFAGEFNGNIINSKSAADVYGVNSVGGLIGCKGQSMGPCMVKTSSFTGNVYASGFRAGGIIGSGYDSASAPNTPVVTIRNCFVDGNVTGTTEVGGILGSEPVCEDCWANGQGSIIDNVFYGKLSATDTNAYIGGIIGFMKSYNENQNMDNNYYIDTCGANKGIGRVEIVNVSDLDLSKCGTAATESEMADGTIVKKLNESVTSFKNWKQGSKHPVHTEDAVAYEITVSGNYKAEFYMGDSFDSTGIIVTANYSDGSNKIVEYKDLVFTGFSSDSVGYKTITVKYGALETSYEVKVIYKAPKAIEAYISIYGDRPHGENSAIHTLKNGGLTQWVTKTSVTIDQNTTVRDILENIALRNGISLVTNPNSQYGYYVEGMTRQGIYLAEFTNGKNSGWMYTVNGTHPQISAEYYFVKDGDEIIWHYTDDYTVEEGSDQWIIPGDESTGGEVKDDTSNKTDEELKAEQIEQIKSELAKVNMKARSTKNAKGNVKVALKADTKTQKFIKEMKDMGYTVKYRFYRSTKKSSVYKSMLTKTSNTYTNTAGKKGVKYYYKVQVRVYDENGKCVAKTALKQCDYAYRTWTK